MGAGVCVIADVGVFEHDHLNVSQPLIFTAASCIPKRDASLILRTYNEWDVCVVAVRMQSRVKMKYSHECCMLHSETRYITCIANTQRMGCVRWRSE